MNSLINCAEKLATESGRPLNTGYLLLAMVGERDACSNLLKMQGLTNTKIRAGLRTLGDEPGDLLRTTMEKAIQIAEPFQVATPAPLHLLVAIASLENTLGARIFKQQGLSRMRIRNQALGHLTGVNRDRGQAQNQMPIAQAKRSEPIPLAEPLRVISAKSDRDEVGRFEKRRRPTARSYSGQPAGVYGINARKHLEMGRDLESKQRKKRQNQCRSRQSDKTEGLTEPKVSNTPPALDVRSETTHAVPLKKRVQPVSKAAIDRCENRFQLTEQDFPLLSSLGRNLTREASEGGLDEIIGRIDEMKRMADILNKRRANSPCLTGKAGVGKTAIVEGLARRLFSGDLPGLGEKIIIEVRPADLLVGTSVRGALAERLSQLREEVARSDGRIILFFDELHALLASNDGAEAIQELKTALGRGELPCIATTTDEEYTRYIEADTALARRFTAVPIGEPSLDEALEILEGVAPAYGEHHQVSFSQEALASAARLSDRYLHERALPDKAIALLDLAGARARRREAARVEALDVAHVLAQQLGVPVERLAATHQERLLNLEESLGKRIISHGHALASLAETLRRNAAGFRSGRPIGSFLFLGPTGVGKTETAKALDDLLFPGGDMIRLDMSEFSESHAVARLIGAPPGYVGHEEGGQLTRAVRAHPYSLVLLDEIEKAHPDVLKLLLQVLEDGRLTDGLGRTVAFENTIIIMTSNLGSDLREQRRQVGFGAARQAEELTAVRTPILGAARDSLPPELWNRIDEPLVFEPLTREHVVAIAHLMIETVSSQLMNEHGIRFQADDSAIESLIRAGGYDPDLGARPMRRTIQSLIEAPVARLILSGEAGREDTVMAIGSGNTVEITLIKDKIQGESLDVNPA